MTSADPKKRNGKRALELAKKLAQFSDYNDAALLDTLAAAHAENLEFEQAVSWEEKALAIAQPEQQPTYQSRLESYRNKKRWWVKE